MLNILFFWQDIFALINQVGAGFSRHVRAEARTHLLVAAAGRAAESVAFFFSEAGLDW
jgi:hypothetical protein